MKNPEQADPLQPILDDAQQELSRRLHEACEAEASGLANKTSEEIREMEDSLLAAAVAAGQTIALRRYMQERDEGATGESSDREVPQTVAREDVSAALPEATLEALPEYARVVREFRDSQGQMWRAWPVIPGLSRTGRPKHYLGDFQRGWICFESLDSPARRRLPCAPARLAETKEEELERLLGEAITAPERRRVQKPH
ncbi:MAG TPA: hypothetical protein VHM30_16465 [Gemmatimonadaceae bacterium]|nr:hypothetical protein [Gemmatimonadaceae bacterium]